MGYKSFENAVGKGEIARNEHLLYKSFENAVGKGEIALLSQCFLLFWRTLCPFHQIWNCRLQTLSVWKSLKSHIGERVNTLL